MTEQSPIGVGLMCKPPRPGVSKTRLAASIGHEAAARLSAAFLLDCAEAVTQAGTITPCRLKAFYRPQDAETELRALLGAQWPLAYADEGDLGATMMSVNEQLLHDCPQGALIMGADVPLLSPHIIADAARIVSQGSHRDIVIVPTEDGGYCLIGMKSLDAARHLFSAMTWSTSAVLSETLNRADRQGLRVSLLEAQRDIDEEPDLVWLRNAVLVHPDLAAHTRRVLAT